MKIKIIAVGKNKSGATLDLCREYLKRLTWNVDLIEIDSPKNASAEQEAKLIQKQIPEKSLIIALDETGKEISSTAFADKIGQWQMDGRDITFLIGGADGFAPELKKNADFMVSFGKQTWPHMLVRVMLLEQIYRAQQILAGHPYHRA